MISNICGPSLVAFALFLILQPGVFVQLPSRIPGFSPRWFSSYDTSKIDILTHSIVYFVLSILLTIWWSSPSFALASSGVTALTFMLFSPGCCCTLTPRFRCCAQKTSFSSIFIQGLLFLLFVSSTMYAYFHTQMQPMIAPATVPVENTTRSWFGGSN